MKYIPYLSEPATLEHSREKMNNWNITLFKTQWARFKPSNCSRHPMYPPALTLPNPHSSTMLNVLMVVCNHQMNNIPKSATITKTWKVFTIVSNALCLRFASWTTNAVFPYWLTQFYFILFYNKVSQMNKKEKIAYNCHFYRGDCGEHWRNM